MNPTLGRPIRLALYCLLAGIVAMGGAAAEPALGAERQIETETERETASERNETDNRLRIVIQPNGSASVRVSYRVALDNPNETAAFRQLRADIRADPARFTEGFTKRMVETAATAEVATGREMTIENMSVRTARRGSDIGVVTYTFAWHGFAATDGKRLSVGDALDGFVLYNGSRLTIAWPAGYEPTTIRPTPDERRANAVVWTAQTTFGGNEPQVVLSSSSVDTNGSAADTGSSEAIQNPSTDFPLPSVVLGALLLVIVVAGGYAIHRRSGGKTVTDGEIATTATEIERGTDATNSGRTAVVGAETDAESELADGEADSGKLLSNEEQVLQVLEQHGGRVKQQQVVTALGWTEARTSQVVSGLRSEGKVEGFRLGRENVLSLPDHSDRETNGDNSA